ncbi:hypothetical protein B0H11DRAFT_1611561, partial [Mycena galericulata]
YIIIDQASSLRKSDLALLESCMSAIRIRAQLGNAALPFAGANIILAGDMHQLPPFITADALFSPSTGGPRSVEGSLIFNSFDTVITLPSRHLNDWREFMERVRSGHCTGNDNLFLQSRIVGVGNPVDFSIPPWDTAPLLTTRNRVVELWNTQAVAKRHLLSGRAHFVCPAVVTVDGRHPTDEERVLINEERASETLRLPDYLEIGLGMRVMAPSGTSTVL